MSNRTRDGAVWQLVGLITRRSQVQILFPQPKRFTKKRAMLFKFLSCNNLVTIF